MATRNVSGAIVLKFEPEVKVWQVHQTKLGQGTKAKVLSFLFLDQALEYVKRVANEIEANRPNGGEPA